MGGRVIFRPIGFFFPVFIDREGLPPETDLGLGDKEGFTGPPSDLLVGGWVLPDGGERGASAGSGADGGANGEGSSAISSPNEGGAIKGKSSKLGALVADISG